MSLINFLRELANESKRLLEGDASIGEHCICLVMTESINIVPPPYKFVLFRPVGVGEAGEASASPLFSHQSYDIT